MCIINWQIFEMWLNSLDIKRFLIYIENEIKKYAAEKPQQVADIVKSWLVESER